MASIRLLAFLPLVSLGACALGSARSRVDDMAFIRTYVPPEQVASCIAQTAGTTSSPNGQGGFVVAVRGPSGATPLTISRDEAQTIILGPTDGTVPPGAGKVAIDCVLKLTPTTE